MEGEIFNLCFLAGRLETVFDLIKGLSIAEKNPVRGTSEGT
jgi:hypothetical protein